MMNLVNDPFRAAEDDALRSRYIQELFQEVVPINTSQISTDIPKVIVQFWHNLQEIPTDVQECLNSWEPLERQGFKRVLFDEVRARRFISKRFRDYYIEAFDRCHHPAMKCDYFRLCYVLIHGGFYVDADEIYQGTDCSHFFRDNRLKIQPLCYDNGTGEMIKPDVFIGHGIYSPDWIFYVNNNPLIAPANHSVIRLALDRATNILLSSTAVQLDIQSTTGPGNLTASLVRHSIACKFSGETTDFLISPDWETVSISQWPLSYRNDERNWRLWNTAFKGKS